MVKYKLDVKSMGETIALIETEDFDKAVKFYKQHYNEELVAIVVYVNDERLSVLDGFKLFGVNIFKDKMFVKFT
jgi:hypothetical protein